MTEIKGNQAYAAWIWTGGTLVFSADYRQLQDAPSIDTLDATAGNDTSKVKLMSFKDGQFTVTLLAQGGGTLLKTALTEGNGGTIIYGEEGTLTGKPKTTIPAFSKGPQVNVQYAGLVEISCAFEQSGDRVYGAF